MATIFLLLSATSLKFKPATPVVFFIFGLLYALLFCQHQINQQLKSPTLTSFSMTIDSLPKYSPNKVSFIAQDTNNNKQYLLSWYKTEDLPLPKLSIDQIYQVTAKLKPPHGTANGIGFDREKWLFRHGIDGIGNIKSIQTTHHNHHSIKNKINQWRLALSEKINQHFESPRINALIHALSIGDKSHFDQHDMKIFQNTGTAHLIAISGLHIGMVALLGWYLGGLSFHLWPKQNLPKPILQVFFGLVFALFYACLAGLAVSTQRAVIMLMVLGCFKLFRRPTYAWDVWSISLLLMLLLDPLNVLDSGFWLSFIAVAVLIFALNGERGHTNKKSDEQNKRANKIYGFIKMQATLLIGMLPLSLAVFSRVNLMSPVVNLLMIPLMTFILVPALLLLLVSGTLFNTFPETFIVIIEWISQLMIQGLDWFNQFSLFALNISVIHWWQYVLLVLGALWLISPTAIPQRYWGFVLIFLGLQSSANKPPIGHFNAHFLDVGQGLSILIETQNHHLVYDVGAIYDSGFNMADAVVIPYLQQQQIHQLDALVLSHQDNDHSGAAKRLQQQIQINTLWGTEASHQACLTGHAWIWDGVKFSFLSPNNLTPYLKNNSSCVLKIEAENTSLLLTGDIEEPVEYRLKNNPNIQADILLMPHHGSKTSSSPDFLYAVNPLLAINSSGQYNPFNHPAQEVLERYKKNNIQVIDTQQSGLITLSTFPALQTQQLRIEQTRIWHTKKPE